MPVVKSKVVTRRVETLRPEKLVRSMGLREFYEKRNKILIIRGCGGLGDILMHRMMFEDFKRLMPDGEIHFACPSYYHGAVEDHPFVDKVLAMEQLDKYEYNISYNTTTALSWNEAKSLPLFTEKAEILTVEVPLASKPKLTLFVWTYPLMEWIWFFIFAIAVLWKSPRSKRKIFFQKSSPY
jgi:hypothetical protein